MRITSCRYPLALLLAFAAVTAVLATPPDPTDPDVRLWLRADDLTGDVGSEVTNWSDASSYGTTFAPKGQRPHRTAACPDNPADRGPTLIQEAFPGNPNLMPALQFSITGGFDAVRQDGTECEPDFEICCFLSNPDNQQRLYQQTNLAEQGRFDPLDIGDGNGLTVFAVFKPVLFENELLEKEFPGGVQTIFAKRGTADCVYSMGIEGRDGLNNVGIPRKGDLSLVQYDSVESYYSDEPLTGDVWNIAAITIDDNDGANVDEVTLYADGEEDSDTRLVQLNEPITTVRRGGTVPEAFGIGGHSQICCGEGERLNGLIAEIIVISRRLDATEFQEIQDYLNFKYFSAMQPPKNLTCARSPVGGVVDLRWDNATAYDSMRILRDGVELAVVASDATSFQDTDVPEGVHTYQVEANLGGIVEGPVCTTSDGVAVRFSSPDPFDPTLRLWLRGSDLAPVDDPNPDSTRQMVTEWLDASSYGTRLGVREGDEGNEDPNGGPWIIGDEPTYALAGFPGNPNALPVAKFDVAGAPLKGNQDRLLQTNNLAEDGDVDPLDIGDGSGLTVVAVYNPVIAGTPELGQQTILGKRGTDSSVYTLGISIGDIGKLDYVTYDENTEYVSDDPIVPNRWHVTFMTIEEAGANDVLNFYDADGEALTQTLAQIGGPIPIAGRNATMPQPFYLAGHAQACCGDGERFAGQIAEVMVFARAIDADERASIFGYLNAKYFSSNQPPEGLVCSREGVGDVVNLTWTNPVNVTYDGITIERDGVEIASLSGDATSFQDTGVPSGARKYDVVATVGQLSGGPTCTARDPAGADVILSAITVYGVIGPGGAEPIGTVRVGERWNTTYLDAAWDVGLLEGPVVDDQAAYTNPDWLNDDMDASVRVTLLPGDTKTYTFAVARNDTFPDWYGMNLFINDSQLQAGGGSAAISVLAFSSDFGSASPFTANEALLTMGWPIAETPGSGSLVFEDLQSNFRIELTDFAIYTQDGLNGGIGIDVVQKQGADLFTTGGTDGVADLIGEFTVTVSSFGDTGACQLAGGGCDVLSQADCEAGGGTYGGDGSACPAAPLFRRGDHDGSGLVDITDPLNLLGFLFLGQTPPICRDASDGDNSAALDISDALNVLGFLFLGSFPLNDTPPGPSNCGSDPAEVVDPDGAGGFPPQPGESIGCDEYPGENGLACP